MKKELRDSWIELGYESFAQKGPDNLKIEQLSKEMNKNKSSFYHLFADLDNFITHLLSYHIKQVTLITKKEANCQTREELIEVFLEHKIDLLFNRQLRIHRNRTEYEICFLKTNEISISSIADIWSKMLGLENEKFLAELIYKLSIENFLLQITEESFNRQWLNSYFDQIRHLVNLFKAGRNQSC